jgi:hypothetical protein
MICASFAKYMPIEQHISMLNSGCTPVYVGISEAGLPSLPPMLMIGDNSELRGSNTGSKKEVCRC